MDTRRVNGQSRRAHDRARRAVHYAGPEDTPRGLCGAVGFCSCEANPVTCRECRAMMAEIDDFFAERLRNRPSTASMMHPVSGALA